MKMILAAASAAAIALVLPAAAQAQDATAPTGLYGNLGYAQAGIDGYDVGAIQGRVGYRMNNWFGVEGELAGGVKSDKSSTTVTSGTTTATVNTKVKLRHAEAIYAVGFVPVSPNLDLLARIGYGNTKAKVTASSTVAGAPFALSDSADGDSFNYGVGAQYHLDGVNGIRVDYTRHDYRDDGAGHADVWSVAYSRKF